jgi:hypothetical protein
LARKSASDRSLDRLDQLRARSAQHQADRVLTVLVGVLNPLAEHSISFAPAARATEKHLQRRSTPGAAGQVQELLALTVRKAVYSRIVRPCALRATLTLLPTRPRAAFDPSSMVFFAARDHHGRWVTGCYLVDHTHMSITRSLPTRKSPGHEGLPGAAEFGSASV